jgi:hypothetical protein
LSTPGGKTALGFYLGGWLDDIISNSIAPSAWAMPTQSLSLQVLVINNASEQGYPTDKVKWILNTSLVEEAAKQLAPWMPIDVSVKFANLSDYPDIDSVLQSSIIDVQNGWTYIDGYNLFYALESMREQHFNYNRAEMAVNAYVFLLKNASMIYGTNEFTGLGGDRQVMILKSIEGYFRADGLTPKSGLSMVMTHELGHNIAFPHTFANFDLYYAGDFAFDVMGYYPYSYYFTEIKIDLYRETYADITLAKLRDALAVDHELYDGQNSSVLIDALFSEIENRIDESSLLFDEQEYLGTVYKLFEAQQIEAYLRELLSNIIHFGDITHDGIVNITDAARIGVAWQSQSNDPNYDFFADLNHNGLINIGDVALIVTNWQKRGEVTAGFFRWATGNKTMTFDYIADVYADWTTLEKNVTYGYWNWNSTALHCSLRIKDISGSDNFVYFNIKIYNQTSTILEVTWNSGDPLPQNWASFSVAPYSKYFVQVEFIGSSNPPAWWSRVTIETKIDSP